ncbi:hypothetical protein Ana3638_03500 [Anaerocolumna sedimenticola]|uniref:Coenzyme F420 hydrogenase/dehydrogenase beta subunit C-terminal domain-containing protein n=1 Tax=Anaerocolumna sedimenticola TaxID=2696063 RepID=A0A6P1TIU4_9FIRM|nr:Coenzyme F420 hydrogenase/dehydrogenase, beta subunit C-terminal domain [Anaerocolumna sedimenticola]QHQ59961.1 hypothetical protein Ana3638_03500 [Anaerocolumna sedimenticola]
MVQTVYAFRNVESILKDSSSGGAFTAIYQSLENLRGRVITYGAAFDSDLKVTHQRAETFDEVRKFRGSKYVQSNMDGILPLIMDDLQQGKTVLFTGTPCQVYSVKHYCKVHEVKISNLLLIDIICHGTVMPSVWEKFKNWLERKYQASIDDFQFRYKGSRWIQYPVKVHFKNGKTVVNTHASRLYTTLFFTALPLREVCYSCKFANLDRCSDITIGDFWGIQRVMPEFPKKNGVSEIIVNTQKGSQIIECIKQMVNDDTGMHIKECTSDAYVKYQHNLKNPTQRPDLREQFIRDLEQQEFETVLKTYAGNNIKGKLLHVTKKVCGEIGLADFIKKVLKR